MKTTTATTTTTTTTHNWGEEGGSILTKGPASEFAYHMALTTAK